MSKSVKLRNSDAIAGRTKKSRIAASAGDDIAQPARASPTRPTALKARVLSSASSAAFRAGGQRADRTSVVAGKSLSVRVHPRGLRTIKKKWQLQTRTKS